MAAAQTPLVVNALASKLFGALQSIPDASTLIETALAYCNGDGTVSRVANQLYCHRNAVLNRLEKLRELTGFDVRRPRDTAAFLYALNAGPNADQESDQAAPSKAPRA
ncbi:helix-turn-helix domain-containing protein [Rhodococcus pyridinivorans]|uniref:helix-turn-helix domain-containing protein n=1 Tax=Rhodococcus pyridinivorans TaxID=103816 RepID=UPI0009332D0E|nr:helix-turn-helix domain-containing protein [Rhodococcus sp. DMU2021]QXF82554.1 PucR family transcriptional regulator [Rhodococcus pyridinivorans]